MIQCGLPSTCRLHIDASNGKWFICIFVYFSAACRKQRSHVPSSHLSYFQTANKSVKLTRIYLHFSMRFILLTRKAMLLVRKFMSHNTIKAEDNHCCSRAAAASALGQCAMQTSMYKYNSYWAIYLCVVDLYQTRGCICKCMFWLQQIFQFDVDHLTIHSDCWWTRNRICAVNNKIRSFRVELILQCAFAHICTDSENGAVSNSGNVPTVLMEI